MKILLSPAKSMNADRSIPDYDYSSIIFEEEALRINKLLRGKSARSLAKLMHISDALASLNADRNQQFSFPFTDENARPAVFYFDGDVYQGLDVETLQAQYFIASCAFVFN